MLLLKYLKKGYFWLIQLVEYDSTKQFYQLAIKRHFKIKDIIQCITSVIFGSIIFFKFTHYYTMLRKQTTFYNPNTKISCFVIHL